ncbi:hypothetical protein HOT99_gp219 [Caulobacter phage CcrBL10]|uniref:Uncharacterized protein n=1 Tax=Caulobacter phage CcrBL10 TaxID=2283269 RepID=A0A385ECD1_9CAUD|nr:hypothetical protein HOT99_gp219 [Caulobacter phage CcrBL10]AXQ68398.1 hypothetical protein CcrBL10_gp194c [Caulobacter phage CcrBL10]
MTETNSPEHHVDLLLEFFIKPPAEDREGMREKLLNCFSPEDLRQMAEGATAAAQRAAQALSWAVRDHGLLKDHDGDWYPIGHRTVRIGEATVNMLIQSGDLHHDGSADKPVGFARAIKRDIDVDVE